MIELIDISKKYGSNSVLNGVNANFELGKTIGIVGKNGAGKTTLFNIISKYDSAFEGEIKFHNAVNEKHLGYLPAELYFYPKMTGKEYLEFCMVAKNTWNHNYLDLNTILDLPLNDYVESYSTGMRKKLGIYGLVLQKNEILILDEPYSGLDLYSITNLDHIISIFKEQKKTIIISSHILPLLNNVSDSIYLLETNGLTIYKPEHYNELSDKLINDRNLKMLTQILNK